MKPKESQILEVKQRIKVDNKNGNIAHSLITNFVHSLRDGN